MASVSFRSVNREFADHHAVRDLDLEIADGELMVLVGPSGCGKTTALRMTAGLEDITSGEIAIGGAIVNDVEPQRRDVAMVFQEYALYPQMSVFDNIAFSLKLRKLDRKEIDRRVTEAARVLDMEDLLHRKPRALSGGQRQRVAMGRALVRNPKVFLMDEPLSNLDAKLRVHMRYEVGRIQRELGTTTIFVTHDQVEAMTMGTRVAVMRLGELQQVDTPQRLYDHPDNTFVASFIGSPEMNLVPARATAADGALQLTLHDGQPLMLARTVLRDPDAPVAGDVILGLRPEALQDATLASGAAAAQTIRATVRTRETLGAELLMHLDAEGATLVARFVPESRALPGDTVDVAVDTAKAHLFDPATEQAL